MNFSEKYRAMAEECFKMAEHVRRDDHRAVIIEMACRWHELAQKAAQEDALARNNPEIEEPADPGKSTGQRQSE